jgi:alpha-glucosidase
MELNDYAKNKNVKLVLWCIFLTLDKQLEEALSQFEKWGISGIKVDFMDRDDQKMVNFYERIVRGAAKHHLLVDFTARTNPPACAAPIRT